MVSYGPWVQDATYMPTWSISTSSTSAYVQDIAQTGHETPYQNPAYQITESDLTITFDLTQTLLAHKGGYAQWLDSGYNLVFPNWKSSWSTRVWARTFPFTNREHLYHPLNHGAIVPETAIGIAFENHPYNPEDPWGYDTWGVGQNLALRLRSTTEFEGQFEDGRVLGGEPLPWSSNSDLMLSVNGEAATAVAEIAGPAFSTSPNWLTQPLGTTLDLTERGALEPGWSASLYTATLAAKVGGDPGYPEDTFTSFGWLIKDLRFEADVRPPLYRWVFGDGDTYRRTFPRDDGLAGGARRNYPPAKSVQYGNRNVGGYL